MQSDYEHLNVFWPGPSLLATSPFGPRPIYIFFLSGAQLSSFFLHESIGSIQNAAYVCLQWAEFAEFRGKVHLLYA